MNASVPLPPQSSTPSSISSSQPMKNNFYQNESIAKPASNPMNSISAKTNIPNTLNVDKVTSNMQNVHLNNGVGGSTLQTQTNPTITNQQLPIQNQIGQPPMFSSSQQQQQQIQNKLTNGNSIQLTSPTSMIPTQPILSTNANLPPPINQQNTFLMQSNQNRPQQQQQQQQQMPTQISGQNQQPQFNGLSQIPNQTLTNQSNQQNQFNNTPFSNATPVLTSNSTIGKRPLYPSQQQQVQLQFE